MTPCAGCNQENSEPPFRTTQSSGRFQITTSKSKVACPQALKRFRRGRSLTPALEKSTLPSRIDSSSIYSSRLEPRSFTCKSVFHNPAACSLIKDPRLMRGRELARSFTRLLARRYVPLWRLQKCKLYYDIACYNYVLPEPR